MKAGFKIAGGVVGTFAVVAVGVTTLSSLAFVDDHEVGIVVDNGSIEGTASPGLNIVGPFFTDIKRLPTTPQTYEVPGLSMSSKDNWALQESLITYTVHVRPSMALELYKKAPNYLSIIDTFVVQHAQGVVGKYDLIDIPKNRSKIEGEILEKVRKSVSEEIGVPLLRNLVFENFTWENAARQHMSEIRQERKELKKARLQQERKKIERKNKEADIAAEAKREKIKQRSAAEARLVKARAKKEAAKEEAEARIIAAEAEKKAIELKNQAKRVRINNLVEAVGEDNAVAILRWENWDGQMPKVVAGENGVEVKPSVE